MFVVAGKLIREAREHAGLTQAELAARLDVSQAAIARLEASRSNPRLATLERTLAATGNRLEVSLSPSTHPGIDESLIASCLERSPEERLAYFTSAYRSLRQLAPTVRSGG